MGCMYLFDLELLFSSGKNSEVKFLDPMLVLSLSFWGPSIVLYIVAAPVYIPTSIVWGFSFLHILSHGYLLSFFISVRWYLMFLISISWWLVMLRIFSCACWPSVCLLWKTIYSYILPIFKMCCLLFRCWVV